MKPCGTSDGVLVPECRSSNRSLAYARSVVARAAGKYVRLGPGEGGKQACKPLVYKKILSMGRKLYNVLSHENETAKL